MTDAEIMDRFFATVSFDRPVNWRLRPDLGEEDDDDDGLAAWRWAFDPRQPRDDQGQWTDTGAVAADAIAARLRAVTTVTRNPDETKFLLPDGTRLATPLSHDQAILLATEGTGLSLTRRYTAEQDAGIVRNAGRWVGVDIRTPLTQAQAEVLAHDWGTVYRVPLLVSFGPPWLDSNSNENIGPGTAKEFPVGFTADAVRQWSEQSAASIKLLARGNWGHAGRPGHVGGSAPSHDTPLVAKVRQVLPLADSVFETRFILPDGTRLTHHDETHYGALEAIGVDYGEALLDGVLRFEVGGGAMLGAPMTEAQAQAVIDAHRAGAIPLQVDVYPAPGGRIGGRALETKVFDDRATTDTIRHWVNQWFPDPQMKAAAFNPQQPRDDQGQWTDSGVLAARDAVVADLKAALPWLSTVSVEAHPLTVRAADVAAEVLREMHAQGYTMPYHVVVQRRAEGNDGEYDEGSRTLTLSLPTALDPTADLDVVTTAAFGGRTATGHDAYVARTYRDIVVHEMGHAQDRSRDDFSAASMDAFARKVQNPPGADVTRRFQAALASVSGYAAQTAKAGGPDRYEFTAEAFTRLYRGEPLTPDAQAIYDLFQGPRIR